MFSSFSNSPSHHNTSFTHWHPSLISLIIIHYYFSSESIIHYSNSIVTLIITVIQNNDSASIMKMSVSQKSLPLYNIHFMILIKSPNREERQIMSYANNEQKDAGMIWLQSALLINAFKPDIRNKKHDFIQEVWSSHMIFLTF